MEEFEKDIQPAKTKKSSMKKFGIAASVICLCLLLSHMAGCRKGSVDDVYVFENASNHQIMEYGGKVMSVGYEGINFFNIDGTERTSAEIHMSAPHVSVSGDMILLYDKGSNKLTVFNGIDKKYSYVSDRLIRSARVNKNGYVVLITDEIAYNSRVTVLDDRGEEIYIWKIGDEYIVDADISPDNKRLAATTITTATGTIVENVIFVDINKAEETGRATNDASMPLQIRFSGHGNAVVVSDTGIACYDYKAKKKWENSFENNLLDYFVIDEDGNTVAALRGIKNNTVIRTYTKNGSTSGEHTTETQLTHIDVNQKNIVLCEKNKISLMNFSGKILGQTEIKTEIEDVAVISDNKVVVLCNDSIQLIKI